MKISYQSSTSEKQFSSRYIKQWRYPKKVIEKILAVENFINQANSLQDIFNYPPFKFHRLKGSLKNEWSIYLGNTGYRVTVIPCDDNGNTITTGDILALSTTIRIIMVTEVSNHYE